MRTSLTTPRAARQSHWMMRYRALATDYDGTLASNGHVAEPTLDALRAFIASGRKLVMVTGRQLNDLQTAFPHIDLFSRVVAENGALLYDPRSKSQEMLAPPPNRAFLAELCRRDVPLSVGQAIVATSSPHEKTVRNVIQEQGLGLDVVLNKDSVMVLPSGITKRTGLKRALEELGISFSQTIGIGDAENDYDFLGSCGYSVAVANALDELKVQVNLVTQNARGAGVAELIEKVLLCKLGGSAPLSDYAFRVRR